VHPLHQVAALLVTDSVTKIETGSPPRAARAALFADVEFAIGAKRIAPLWRILDGVAAEAWTDAIDMTGAQVAVAAYCPGW
jgi:hypothetical protein